MIAFVIDVRTIVDFV